MTARQARKLREGQRVIANGVSEIGIADGSVLSVLGTATRRSRWFPWAVEVWVEVSRTHTVQMCSDGEPARVAGCLSLHHSRLTVARL